METNRQSNVARKEPKFSGGFKYLDNTKLLIQATKLGNEALVKKLLSVEVPLYISDKFGCGPIYYATRYNHLNLLKTLVDAGGPLRTTTKMKRTPLQIAAYHGHTDCVEYLLALGVDVDAVDSLGMTALHWAAENNHLATLKALLRAGADQKISNKFGKTPQKLAFLKNNVEIFRVLQENIESKSFLPSKSPTYSNQSDGKTYTTVFISENNVSDKLSAINSRLFEKELGDRMSDKTNAIKLLEHHGIRLLPVDESTVIGNALKRGQKAVLTEAGKLALQKTKPNNIIQSLANSSNTIQFEGIPPSKKLKHDNGNLFSLRDELPAGAKKVIKIDAADLADLTSNTKLIISRPLKMTAPCTRTQPGFNRAVCFVDSQDENPFLLYESKDERLKFLEQQLEIKSELVKDLKNQLKLSMEFIKNLKTKYEIKEREASLYKIQLLNITKIISRRTIK